MKPTLMLRIPVSVRPPVTAALVAGLLADPGARVPGEGLRRAAGLRIAPLLRGLLDARLPRVLGLARAEALGVHGVHLVALAAVRNRAVARVLDVVARPRGELRRAAVVAADLHERLVGRGQVLAARALHDDNDNGEDGEESDDDEEGGPGEQTGHALFIGRAGARQQGRRRARVRAQRRRTTRRT